MSELRKILAHGVRHPFSLTIPTNLLNNSLYKHIEGDGPCEEYSADNFEPDIEHSLGIDIYKSDELYEDNVSIILLKLINGKCYRFPKEHFNLVKDIIYEQKILRERFPEYVIRSLYSSK